MRAARHALALSLLLSLIAAPAPAQEPVPAEPPILSATTGAVRGAVIDEAGLPVPGVSLTLSGEPLIGGDRTAASDVSGRFVFGALPPGLYRLVAEKPGFRSVQLEGVAVNVNRAVQLTVELTLDGAAEEIVVSESASRGRVLSREFLERVPVGREYQGVQGGVAGGVVGGVVGGVLGGVAGGVAGTEQYTDYGVNGWTRASRDALSTFAIDVDTASYAIARRKLQSGALPPPASVRVEEFVNAFDYDYRGPPPVSSDLGGDPAPFAVNLEAAEHPFSPGTHLLRVGVQGRTLEVEDRPPVHLTFLVDTSGSMNSPDKIDLARHALGSLVNQLQPDDTVAIATYAGHVSRVLSPTPAGDSRAIHRALEGLMTRGSTAMSSGIDLAYEMARTAYVEGHENRVIVLSDGDANVGPASHELILRTIRNQANDGVTLTTVGFGMGNYKDTMMEQLANRGDGNYFYVDSAAEAEKVFGVDLAGTLRVIARDVKIQVEFDPEAVRRYRLVGYENRDIADEDFRDDAVDAGELGSGHQVTALYELELTGEGLEGGGLGEIRLRAKAPGRDGRAKEWTTPMPAAAMVGELEAASGSLRKAAAVAMFAERLRGSPELAPVSYQRLYGLAFGAHDPDDPQDVELLGLIERAAALSGEAEVSRR